MFRLPRRLSTNSEAEVGRGTLSLILSPTYGRISFISTVSKPLQSSILQLPIPSMSFSLPFIESERIFVIIYTHSDVGRLIYVAKSKLSSGSAVFISIWRPARLDYTDFLMSVVMYSLSCSPFLLYLLCRDQSYPYVLHKHLFYLILRLLPNRKIRIFLIVVKATHSLSKSP